VPVEFLRPSCAFAGVNRKQHMALPPTDIVYDFRISSAFHAKEFLDRDKFLSAGSAENRRNDLDLVCLAKIRVGLSS
jgi:hypothetical protein